MLSYLNLFYYKKNASFPFNNSFLKLKTDIFFDSKINILLRKIMSQIKLFDRISLYCEMHIADFLSHLRKPAPCSRIRLTFILTRKLTLFS